mmetsp:Transcript_15007/g.44420  ORF Transcript_15007/g.44420 Transcript_15007/m.44420 type:complete len:637 (+) Transcript_15007:1174-3084(+)
MSRTCRGRVREMSAGEGGTPRQRGDADREPLVEHTLHEWQQVQVSARPLLQQSEEVWPKEVERDLGLRAVYGGRRHGDGPQVLHAHHEDEEQQRQRHEDAQVEEGRGGRDGVPRRRGQAVHSFGAEAAPPARRARHAAAAAAAAARAPRGHPRAAVHDAHAHGGEELGRRGQRARPELAVERDGGAAFSLTPRLEAGGEADADGLLTRLLPHRLAVVQVDELAAAAELALVEDEVGERLGVLARQLLGQRRLGQPAPREHPLQGGWRPSAARPLPRRRRERRERASRCARGERARPLPREAADPARRVRLHRQPPAPRAEPAVEADLAQQLVRREGVDLVLRAEEHVQRVKVLEGGERRARVRPPHVCGHEGAEAARAGEEVLAERDEGEVVDEHEHRVEDAAEASRRLGELLAQPLKQVPRRARGQAGVLQLQRRRPQLGAVDGALDRVQHSQQRDGQQGACDGAKRGGERDGDEERVARVALAPRLQGAVVVADAVRREGARGEVVHGRPAPAVHRVAKQQQLAAQLLPSRERLAHLLVRVNHQPQRELVARAQLARVRLRLGDGVRDLVHRRERLRPVPQQAARVEEAHALLQHVRRQQPGGEEQQIGREQRDEGRLGHVHELEPRHAGSNVV